MAGYQNRNIFIQIERLRRSRIFVAYFFNNKPEIELFFKKISVFFYNFDDATTYRAAADEADLHAVGVLRGQQAGDAGEGRKGRGGAAAPRKIAAGNN